MDCSANLRSLTEGSLDVQSLVYREKSSGEKTQALRSSSADRMIAG